MLSTYSVCIVAICYDIGNKISAACMLKPKSLSVAGWNEDSLILKRIPRSLLRGCAAAVSL